MIWDIIILIMFVLLSIAFSVTAFIYQNPLGAMAVTIIGRIVAMIAGYFSEKSKWTKK